MLVKTLRARPLEVQAVQWNGTRAQGREIIEWIKENGGLARFAFEAIEVNGPGKDLMEQGEWVTFSDGKFKVVSNKIKREKWEEVNQ